MPHKVKIGPLSAIEPCTPEKGRYTYNTLREQSCPDDYNHVMGCTVDSSDLKCPLNWPINHGTRSCICHSILVHFCCLLVLNELGIAFENGKKHLIIPAHLLAQSFGEKSSRGYDAAGLYRPTWTVCLFDVYSNHSLWVHWWSPKELFTQKHRSPSLEYFPITSDHLYRYILQLVYMASLICGGALLNMLKDPQRPIHSEWLWGKSLAAIFRFSRPPITLQNASYIASSEGREVDCFYISRSVWYL